MSYVYVPWPAWCTGPNGESRVFDREEDVPAGWTHHEEALPQLDHDGNGKPGGSVSGGAGDEIGALRDAYRDRFGKRPFMGWDADTLKAKLAL